MHYGSPISAFGATNISVKVFASDPPNGDVLEVQRDVALGVPAGVELLAVLGGDAAVYVCNITKVIDLVELTQVASNSESVPNN